MITPTAPTLATLVLGIIGTLALFGASAALDWAERRPDAVARCVETAKGWATLGLAAGIAALPAILLVLGLSERI